MRYVIDEKIPLSSVPGDAREVHFTRPVSGKKIRGLVQHCPSIQSIGMSPSVEKRLSPNVRKFILDKKIEITRPHRRAGRALNIDLNAIKTIADLRKDFLSMRDISTKTGIPKSTIHYLLKKAKRNKLRKGKQIIYL